jgi:hypothetical protein
MNSRAQALAKTFHKNVPRLGAPKTVERIEISQLDASKALALPRSGILIVHLPRLLCPTRRAKNGRKHHLFAARSLKSLRLAQESHSYFLFTPPDYQMTQAALAYPFAKRSRATTAFVDLPEDIRSKVIEHVPDEYDRVRLSTCHSSMACYDYLSDLVLKLPLGTEKVMALSTWATSTHRMLKNIYIEDERDAFWSMDEIARDRLMDGLAAASDGLERLVVVSKFTPYRALLPVMRNAKRVHFPANNPFPSDLSLETCTTLETLWITEIENNDLDEDAPVDFGGIAKAPALRNVYITAQRRRFWISDLPLVKDTLETLVIIGTDVDAGIVHNLGPWPRMSKLQMLALDSFSSHITADLALAMPQLECLDLSRRHDDFDWRNILDNRYIKSIQTSVRVIK